MMTAKERGEYAAKFYTEGRRNCAQAVLMAFADELGEDERVLQSRPLRRGARARGGVPLPRGFDSLQRTARGAREQGGRREGHELPRAGRSRRRDSGRAHIRAFKIG